MMITLKITDTDNLMNVYEEFSKNKKILILAIIHLSQNIIMIQTN